MSSNGFAIGNGLSREGFDLDRLRGKGITVGCNRVYLRWEPDYLVTLDEFMLQEIRDYRAANKVRWKHLSRYRPDHDNLRTWLSLEGEPVCPIIEINQGYNNNSGVMAAAYLAEVLKCDVVYLLGIDYFCQVPGKVNDMYSRNTNFAPGLIGVWNRLAKNNPDTRFIRVGRIPARDLDVFFQLKDNYEFIDYEDFDIDGC